jgi:predicted HTH domain antitoxin
MKTISLRVPDALDIDAQQFSVLVASHLYGQGKLSLGQAAEMTGLSTRTFAELLGAYNISIFNYPASELKHDVECVE